MSAGAWGHTVPMAQTTGSTTDSGELEQKQILKKYLQRVP